MTPGFRGVLWLAFIILLFFASTKVHAVTPDDLLNDGKPVQAGLCAYNHEPARCIEFQYQTQNYVVILADDLEPFFIYKVHGDKPYSLDASDIVWTRTQKGV